MATSTHPVSVSAAAEEDRSQQQMLDCGYLEVVSPHDEQRVYRIQPNGSLVQMYEHGRHTLDLCLPPAAVLPAGKTFALIIRRLIESNEEAYLAVAKPTIVRGPLESANRRWGVGRPSGRARLAMARSEWY